MSYAKLSIIATLEFDGITTVDRHEIRTDAEALAAYKGLLRLLGDAPPTPKRPARPKRLPPAEAEVPSEPTADEDM